MAYLKRVMRIIPYRRGFFQVRLRLHYTWWFAFVFVTFVVATQYQETVSMWNRLAIGTLIVLILLALVTLRQLVLNWIAIRRRIPLRVVAMHVMGGVPGVPRQFTSPATELILGVSGLVVSLLGILILYLVYIFTIVNDEDVIGGSLRQLLYFMALFTIIHCLPGYPLDAGRIVRALVWRANKDYDRSTRIAGRMGQVAGALVILYGIVMAFLGEPWVTDAGLIVVGLAIFISATSVFTTTELRRYLADTKLSEISLSGNFSRVSEHLTVEDVVRDCVYARGDYFFVKLDQNRKLTGYFTLHDIMKVPRKLWPSRQVKSIGTQTEGIYETRADIPAANVLEQMVVMDISQMPVVQDGDVMGLIRKEDLVHLTLVRRDLRFVSEAERVTGWWERLRMAIGL